MLLWSHTNYMILVCEECTIQNFRMVLIFEIFIHKNKNIKDEGREDEGISYQGNVYYL